MLRRLVLVLLAAAACHRRAGPPDASYAKARDLYGQLYARQLDDAYADPKMDEIEALLRQVSADSIDAQPAQELLGTIQRGKAEYENARADREQRAKQLASPPRIDINPLQVLAASTPDAGAAAAPRQDPYGPGAPVSEINAASGGCLTPGEPFTEQGSGTQGTVYRVSGAAACAERLPGLVGQAVLVVDGAIYRRMADFPPPAPRPPPDAGAPRPAAPPPAPAAPEDAGVIQLYPGTPLPEGYRIVEPDAGAP